MDKDNVIDKNSEEYQEELDLLKQVMSIELDPFDHAAALIKLGMIAFDGNEFALIDFLENLSKVSKEHAVSVDKFSEVLNKDDEEESK